MKRINYKKIIIFILLVILAFLCLNIFFDNCYGDPLYEYIMVHGFVSGSVPYTDINTVVPPFFMFFYSPFIFIYDDMTTMLIVNSVLIVIMFYLMYKILGNKWWIMLFVCSLSLFLLYYPGYNTLVFFLIILLLYLEDKKSNDYLIGVVLALIAFTKHSIGAPVILMSFLYLKNFDKIKKRTISILIVSLIFLLYFVIAGNLYNFIDLCVLGLFDFTNNAHIFSKFSLMAFIIILIINIYQIIKRKGFIPYYAIACLFFTVPIILWWKICFPLVITVMGLLYNFELKEKYVKMYIVYSLIIFLLLFGANVQIRKEKLHIYSNWTIFNQNHFKYSIVEKDVKVFIKDLNKEYNKYDNAIIAGGPGTMVAAINDQKLNYFNFFFVGNFGYNGSDKMINKFKKSKDTYYFIYDYGNPEYNKTAQLDNKIINYIKKILNILNRCGIIEYIIRNEE